MGHLFAENGQSEHSVGVRLVIQRVGQKWADQPQ